MLTHRHTHSHSLTHTHTHTHTHTNTHTHTHTQGNTLMAEVLVGANRKFEGAAWLSGVGPFPPFPGKHLTMTFVRLCSPLFASFLLCKVSTFVRRLPSFGGEHTQLTHDLTDTTRTAQGPTHMTRNTDITRNMHMTPNTHRTPNSLTWAHAKLTTNGHALTHMAAEESYESASSQRGKACGKTRSPEAPCGIS